jgi:glycogen operon protein
MRVWPGTPYPLGATWDGVGVNFAIFSEHGTRVELCLFDSVDAELESVTIPLPEHTDMVWHGYLPDVRPGSSTATASTALRAAQRPPLQPAQARHGSIREGRGSHGALARVAVRFHVRVGRHDVRRSRQRPYAPLAAVIDNAFTWGDDRPLRTPWHETLIYEMHVKGFTKLNPYIRNRCAAPTSAWRPSRRFAISRRSASPRWS